LTYWLHPDAEIELEEAARYYAQHANLAVADAFISEFERVLTILIANPFLGANAEHGFRVYHLERFPYSLIYEPNVLSGPQIYAVAHQRRRPRYWLSRGGGR